ncbi:hypothetical protein M5K25_000230 [Dendrobium thyrsiflorum]|uniref:CRAL-TRIO domain-containing protein n=1 Tax=Dendrobium thyrsiflorum TaxID=117978 RepID=A0ABD0VUU4_DENTH
MACVRVLVALANGKKRKAFVFIAEGRGGEACVVEMESKEEAEWKLVAQMRSVVEAKDPAAKEVDDFMIRRFLRSRDSNLEKASDMFLKFLKWRTTVHNGFISEAQIQNELSQNKLFIQGFSKKGSPILIAFPSKHYPSKRDMNEFKNLVVYYLDKICDMMTRNQEKLVSIVDFQGWGYSNCDIRGYLAALDILQNYYPERLGKVFLIHVPSLFMRAWKIVYPYIDKNTRNKFIFVEDKNLRASLLEDIDEDQLLEIYGGKLKMMPH